MTSLRVSNRGDEIVPKPKEEAMATVPYLRLAPKLHKGKGVEAWRVIQCVQARRAPALDSSPSDHINVRRVHIFPLPVQQALPAQSLNDGRPVLHTATSSFIRSDSPPFPCDSDEEPVFVDAEDPEPPSKKSRF